jgi:hypothetical protein
VQGDLTIKGKWSETQIIYSSVTQHRISTMNKNRVLNSCSGMGRKFFTIIAKKQDSSLHLRKLKANMEDAK